MQTIELPEVNIILIEELSKYYTVIVCENHGMVHLELYDKQ